MEFKFKGMTISSEEDIRELPERINSYSEFAKKLEKYGIKDEHIDVEKAIRIYREKLRKLNEKSNFPAMLGRME